MTITIGFRNLIPRPLIDLHAPGPMPEGEFWIDADLGDYIGHRATMEDYYGWIYDTEISHVTQRGQTVVKHGPGREAP